MLLQQPALNPRQILQQSTCLLQLLRGKWNKSTYHDQKNSIFGPELSKIGGPRSLMTSETEFNGEIRKIPAFQKSSLEQPYISLFKTTSLALCWLSLEMYHWKFLSCMFIFTCTTAGLVRIDIEIFFVLSNAWDPYLVFQKQIFLLYSF